jgi:uncharacterized membrane protein HdeD (DUF308 family)
MHWLGRLILGIAGILMLVTGVWLLDTPEVIVQMGGALSGLIGIALIVLAFGTRADWNRWQKPPDSKETTEK